MRPSVHSFTKLAHLHFPSTEDYGRRIRQLGEEAWRVTVSGQPGLDEMAVFVAQPQGGCFRRARSRSGAAGHPVHLPSRDPDPEGTAEAIADVLAAAAKWTPRSCSPPPTPIRQQPHSFGH